MVLFELTKIHAMSSTSEPINPHDRAVDDTDWAAKNLVWVPDEQHGYVSALVVQTNADGDNVSVQVRLLLWKLFACHFIWFV